METGLTRRSFLGVAGGTVAAIGAGGLFARCGGGGGGPDRDVVVAGAGLAGLTAAFELQQAGMEVTLVEARDRVGGRVHTVREPFTGGQHAEAGGEYVDGIHTNLRAYARRFGLPLERVDRGFGDLRGLVLVDRSLAFRDEFVSGEAERDLARFNREVLRAGGAIDPGDPVATAGDLDKRNVASLVAQLDPSPGGRFLIDTYLRDFYATTADDLSLLYLAAQERLYRDVPSSQIEYARIRGGNDGLTGAFAERLDDVRLGAPVTEVAESDYVVEVTAGGETITARHVVLAAPLPALASVDFAAGLSSELQAAVGGITYGRVTKNLIQTDERVWRQQGSTGDLVTDGALGSTWEATDQQPGRSGVLIDYAGADASDTVAALEPPARERFVRSRLDSAFPGFDAAAGGFATFAWPDEEYTGGSWIAPRPGELSRHWPVLREPHGRLSFAGEHTAVISGYMEGAIRSGRRAAAQVRAAAS